MQSFLLGFIELRGYVDIPASCVTQSPYMYIGRAGVLIKATLFCKAISSFFTLSVRPKVINLSFYKNPTSTEKNTHYYFVHLENLLSLFEYVLCTLTILNTQKFNTIKILFYKSHCYSHKNEP